MYTDLSLSCLHVFTIMWGKIPSLSPGDEIVDATVIDDGWMEGRVKRTGQFGMLPSNYVERQ